MHKDPKQEITMKQNRLATPPASLLPRALWLTGMMVLAGMLATAASPVFAQSSGQGRKGHSGPVGAKSTRTNVRKSPVSQQQMADYILGDTMEALDSLRDVHFHEGEYNHIVNLSYILVQGVPYNMPAYADAAYLLWSTDRNDQAIAFLKQGLRANPNNYYMYDELGSHYLIMHPSQPAKALPYYEQAVKFHCPYSPWHALARCYEQTNQWDKAVQAWQKAASSYPDDALAPVRMKRAKAELAKHQGGSQ